jgi:ferredoxin
MNKLKLLRYKCNGCGYCTSLAPELLIISTTDGKVTSLERIYAEDEEIELVIESHCSNIAQQAVKICPVKALKLD